MNLDSICSALCPIDRVSNASRNLPKVMRSFGWNPKDEEVKDMVNVIDQVDYSYIFCTICLKNDTRCVIDNQKYYLQGGF